MSLAMFAASINDNSNITLPMEHSDNNNLINQKRHKRTQRKYPNPKFEQFDTNKMTSAHVQQLHNSHGADSDDEDKGEFQLLPPPQLVNKPVPTSSNQSSAESFGGMEFPLGNNNYRFVGKSPMPASVATTTTVDNLDLNDFVGNYGDEKRVENYYKRVLPGYNNNNNNNHNNHSNKELPYATQDVLLQKLNYMISLLEDQQDVKTNNVTEEVVLYSFLGIFIIFIADTFVRAGKYVR